MERREGGMLLHAMFTNTQRRVLSFLIKNVWRRRNFFLSGTLLKWEHRSWERKKKYIFFIILLFLFEPYLLLLFRLILHLFCVSSNWLIETVLILTILLHLYFYLAIVLFLPLYSSLFINAFRSFVSSFEISFATRWTRVWEETKRSFVFSYISASLSILSITLMRNFMEQLKFDE